MATAGWFSGYGQGYMGKTIACNTPILRWNNKMCDVRKHLSGWASHNGGILKKKGFAYQP
jgi:hypothetical protein